MPGKQLNPQHPGPHQQCRPCHQPRSDEEGCGRVSCRIDQGELTTKASKRAQFLKTLQELREAVAALQSRAINNNKFQAFDPSVPQAGYSLIKMDVEDCCHQVRLLSAEAAEEVMDQGISAFRVTSLDRNAQIG